MGGGSGKRNASQKRACWKITYERCFRMKYTGVPVTRDVGPETSVSEVFATVSGYSGFWVIVCRGHAGFFRRCRSRSAGVARRRNERTEKRHRELCGGRPANENVFQSNHNGLTIEITTVTISELGGSCGLGNKLFDDWEIAERHPSTSTWMIRSAHVWPPLPGRGFLPVNSPQKDPWFFPVLFKTCIRLCMCMCMYATVQWPIGRVRFAAV